jgi:hypothetical protein
VLRVLERVLIRLDGWMDGWMERIYILSVHVDCSVRWRWMDVLSVHIEIGPRSATLSLWPL